MGSSACSADTGSKDGFLRGVAKVLLQFSVSYVSVAVTKHHDLLCDVLYSCFLRGPSPRSQISHHKGLVLNAWP